MQAIIRQLLAEKVTSVVYFGDSAAGISLLKAAGEVQDAGSIQWILATSLGDDSSQLQNVK